MRGRQTEKAPNRWMDVGRLFGDTDFETFRRKYWPARPFLCHASPKRLAGLIDAPQLSSIESFIASQPPNINAWSANAEGQQIRLEGIASSHASVLLGTGTWTIVANGINEHVSATGRLMREMGFRLGYPEFLEDTTHVAPLKSCNAYATRSGFGSPRHFDCQEVFILQLIGEKRWRYGANASVQFPSRSFFPTPDDHYTDDPQLQLELAGKDIERDWTSRPKSTVLRPGSILFLPRGFWHETTTVTDSLHLTLTFPTPTWLSTVSRMLWDELIADPTWRTPFSLPPEATTMRAQVATKFRALGDRLGAIEEGAVRSTIVRHGLLPDAKLRRVARTSIDVRETPGSVFIKMRAGRETLDVEIDKELLPWANRFAGLKGTWTFEKALEGAQTEEDKITARTIINSALDIGFWAPSSGARSPGTPSRPRPQQRVPSMGKKSRRTRCVSGRTGWNHDETRSPHGRRGPPTRSATLQTQPVNGRAG